MPRNGSGTYTLPEAAFVPGTTISSSAVNADVSDIASALTGSVASDGQTPMTGQFKALAGYAGNPGLTFSSAPTNGFFLSGLNQIGVAISGVVVGYFSSVGWTSVAGVPTGVPISASISYGGASAPSGWLFCYGQAVSRTTYALLFAVIGTTFGAGDAVTTFNLPDLRGRVDVGKDDMGGASAGRMTVFAPSGNNVDGNTLGASGGSQSHLITTPQSAAHFHGVSGTTDPDGVDHTHPTDYPLVAPGAFSSGGQNGLNPGGSSRSKTSGGASAFLHTHTYSTNSATSGGDGLHNNVQPTLILNKIMYAGA